jgi:hypothetical protein
VVCGPRLKSRTGEQFRGAHRRRKHPSAARDFSRGPESSFAGRTVAESTLQAGAGGLSVSQRLLESHADGFKVSQLVLESHADARGLSLAPKVSDKSFQRHCQFSNGAMQQLRARACDFYNHRCVLEVSQFVLESHAGAQGLSLAPKFSDKSFQRHCQFTKSPQSQTSMPKLE